MWSSSSSSADLVGRGGQRLDLLEDVEAVGLVLDQPLQPRAWPSIRRSRFSSSRAVLGVRVPEVGEVPVRVLVDILRGQYADAGDRSIRRYACATRCPNLNAKS